MSRISTDLEVLVDELIVKLLKPKLIADGYYADVLNAVDNVKADVRSVHDLIALLRAIHDEVHQPGPMRMCTPVCRLADAL